MVEAYKLSGAGNDFLALVEPARPPSAEEIRAWCRRGLSLGADGVFTLQRIELGAHMVHYNADGGRAELCLNGSRCAARLAFELGWANTSLQLLTDAGVLRAERLALSEVAVELPPIVEDPEEITLEVEGQKWAGHYLWVGVPHFVLAWPEDLKRAPVAELGPRLRAHPDLGPDGANVHFVDFREPHHLAIRTFERGVEAETLACGTGVVASVRVGLETGEVELPASVATAGGFELTLARVEERFELAGDARILMRGEIYAGAKASSFPSYPEAP